MCFFIGAIECLDINCVAMHTMSKTHVLAMHTMSKTHVLNVMLVQAVKTLKYFQKRHLSA